MKVYYDCAPCFLRQAREACDLATDDEDLKIEIMAEIFKYLASHYSHNANSNSTGSVIHNLIKEKTDCRDPYKSKKILGNKIALKFLPEVKKIIADNDSLENYVKIAIIGNILDFGAFELDDDMESLIKEALVKDLAINDSLKLDNDLKTHKKLLFLADNAGEIVFDKLLLEKFKTYGIDITIVVKEEPILNDACMEDALEIGLDEFGDIITMAGTVGLVYTENTKEFQEIFNSYDLIISKGMGNFEGLTELDLSGKNVYYLLAAKCAAITKYLGINLNDMILLKSD